MTHAERQKAYRKRQGWAGKKREAARKKEARKGAMSVTSVTIAPPVRDAKREVQETEYVSMDEVEGDTDVMREHRERMEKYRTPALVTRQMEPRERVVAEVQTAEERRIAEWLERKKVDRPTGDVMSGTGIEVEMDAI